MNRSGGVRIASMEFSFEYYVAFDLRQSPAYLSPDFSEEQALGIIGATEEAESREEPQ